MSYDVFLVAAPTKEKDREMARLVARRLRSMRMRVWYDAKAEDDVFDAKEARAIERSAAMLVLWSKDAAKSNFVRGAAAQGYSLARDEEKEYPFIQAALDDVKPYDPYSVDDLHDLKGFTTRTNTQGWFDIVARLETFQGRRDLKDWLLIATKDKDAQEEWRKAHPDDRLSVKGTPPGQKKPVSEAGAASIAAKSSAPRGRGKTAEPSPPPSPPAAPPLRTPSRTKAATTQLSARATPTPGPATLSGSQAGGAGTIAMIGSLIALMFVMAWLLRSSQVPQSGALPPVARAQYLTCPPGTLPRDVFQSQLLEPSRVVDDTAAD